MFGEKHAECFSEVRYYRNVDMFICTRLLIYISRPTLAFEIANNKQQSGFLHDLSTQITYPMKWPDIFILPNRF